MSHHQSGHNPGIHELAAASYNPSVHEISGDVSEGHFTRRLFLSALAIGGLVVAKNHTEYSAAEAHESVLSDLPEVTLRDSALPQSSQEKFNNHVGAIDHMRPVYEAVEKETGVPWKFMAAIHYREGSNSPGSSMFAGEKLGTTNPDFGDVKGTDIFSNGIKAAQHFIGNAKSVYGVDVRPDMSDTELAAAFLAYNRGSMYRNAKRFIGHEMTPDQSPYVMNGLDEQHVDMRWPAQGSFRGPGTDWGEPESVQGKRNAPLGALTIVRGLKLREQGGEAIAPERKIVVIADSLGVGDEKFGKIQDADAFFKKQIIHYDAAGSRPLVGVNDGVSAIAKAEGAIKQADTLVIALGTNMPETESTYETSIRETVAHVRSLKADIKVVMPEIISFKDGTKMASRRDARNTIMKALASEGLITFLPIEMPDEDFAPDNIHLTTKGYQQRAAQILRAA